MTPHRPLRLLLSIGLLSLNANGWGAQSPPQTTPKFTELSQEDVARLDAQRALVAKAAKKRYGTKGLTRTTADLPVLQRLLDDHAFGKTQTYELQSLGVVFGDLLSRELPLRWVMVTDEFGTDPTLRFKDTTIQVNALTMISKRVERDEHVSVSRLLEITRDQLGNVEKNLQK